MTTRGPEPPPPPLPEPPACGNCAFWKRDTTALDEGECHRRAPKPVPVTGPFPVMWPSTAEGDFCGDWLDGSGSGGFYFYTTGVHR